MIPFHRNHYVKVIYYKFLEKDDLAIFLGTYIFCPSIVHHCLLVCGKDQWIETSVSKELHSAEGESFI